jgi:ABC-type Fe3+-hydroxamate transport system substrate-binding protein
MMKIRITLTTMLMATFTALILALPHSLSAAEPSTVNSICPVTGKPIDTALPPVIITLGKGERAQRVVIGVADRAAADKVKANPSTYVEAAKANRKVP